MGELIQTGIRVQVDLGNSVGNAQNFAKVISEVGKTATKASAEFKKSAQEISANARSIGNAMGISKASDLAKSVLEANKAMGMLGASTRNTETQIRKLTESTKEYVSVASKLGMQTKAVLDYAAAWNKLSEIGMKRMAGSEWAAKLSTASTPSNLPILSQADGDKQITLLNRLKAGWMGLAGAALVAKEAFSTAGRLFRITDEYSGLIARTKLVARTQEELAIALNSTYQIALDTRAPIKEVTQLYYRLSVAMATAGKTQQDAVTITDLVAKSLKVSGASATETEGALQQFSQAMQAGVLNGDEFRSVMENMPRVALALTTALGVNIATLREWSSQGKLTFNVITEALLSQKAAIDADFKSIPITVEGALTNIQTAAQRWLGQVDQTAQGSRQLAESLNYLALNFDDIANVLTGVVSPSIRHTVDFFKFYSDVVKDLNKNLKEMVGLQDAGAAIDPEIQKLMAMGRGEWKLPEPPKPFFSGQGQMGPPAPDPKEVLKAQEQAQKTLEASIRQRVETERQAGELFKAQAETRLKALESERDQMEANFKLELDSAVSFQQKENINANLVKARQDSLRKEFAIKQDIIGVEGEILRISYDAYNSELARAKQLGLREEEIIALQTTKLGIENEVKILNETSAQQQIELNDQIRKASEQAIESKAKEKSATSDVVLEYQKELDIFLKLSAAKAGGATTEQLGVMRSVYERTQGMEGAVSKKQLATLQQYLISIEVLKSATGELAGKEQDAREEALRMLEVMNSNLEYAKEVAAGLTEAFDSVGAAIGGMAVAMAEYGKQQVAIEVQRQEEIKKAAGDPGKIAKAETDASQKSARAQIKNYGDITQAAQGFFKKGTAGYQAMGTAVKVFRAFEMAQSVMSAMKQIEQMGGLLTAFTASLAQMGALSDANTTKEIANSAAGASAKAAEGAANQGSSGDPYSAFARVAAWVALMAGLGIAISGGASATPTMTGKDYAKQQEEAFAATLGSTVLGGAEASASIQNSLDLIAENSTANLDYSQGLLKAFEELSAAMTGLAAAVATSFSVNTSGLNLGKTGSNILAFGAGNTKRELAGQGLTFTPTRLGKLLDSESIQGQQYVDVLVTKTKGYFFGLITKTKQSIETTLSPLPKAISNQVVNVFDKLKSTFIKAADNVGMGGATLLEGIDKFRINLGKIPFGDDAKKNAQLLQSAINRQADLMAKKLLPAYRDSQIVGEGYFETFNRVSNAISQGRAKLAQFNINAISYNQIMFKKGDIEKQIVTQSILASNATSDLKDIIAELPGTADDAITAFSNLLRIKDLFISTGQASVQLSNGLILASGGIEQLKSNLETYFDRFFTDAEKLGANTVTLANKFSNFGLTMPSVANSFDAVSGKVVTAKEGYRIFVESLGKDTSEAGIKLHAFALSMAGEFADTVDLNTAVLQKSIEDQIAMYNLLGDSESATRLERQKNILALSESERALAIAMFALKDAVDAAKVATDNQITVYRLIGETEKAISLERAKALSTMTEADRAFATTLYSLQDAIDLAKKATDNQIAVYKALGDTEKVVSLERAKAISTMTEADKAFAISLYALEDAVQIVKESTNNQIAIYKLLGEQDPAAKEKALQLEREKAMAGMDASTRQFTIVVNNLTDANNALNESSSALQTAYDNLTSMRNAFVDLGQGIRDYYNELTGAQSPNLTPEARYQTARTAFTQVSALAAQGIQSALGDLPNVAKDFLEASREFNASGPAYQLDFKSVLDALQSGMSAADKQIEIMNKQLAEAEKSNANLLKVDASTSTVNSSIAGLQIALANFNSSLVNYNTATQQALVEAIRQASAGSAASGTAAGAGATADAAAAKAQADAAAQAAAAKAAADAAAAKAKADLAARTAAAEAAAAAAAQAERQRQAQAAAQAAAAAEAERQRQAQAAAAAAAAAATRIATAKEYSSSIKTYIRTGNFDNAKIIIDRAIAAGFNVVQTAGANTKVKKSDDVYTVDGYAKGGYATPGMALVGEQGPELINFASPGQVYTAGQTQNILSAGSDNQKKQTEAAEQQVAELQALIKLQQAASIEMIRELKGLKAEIATLTKKAKLEAAS